MIHDDLKQYPKAIYIHLYKDHMSLIAKDGSIEVTEFPQVPYHHPRMIIGDFESADLTLKALLKHHSNPFSFLKLRRSIAIVQIMEPIEGNLAKVEKRVLRELFFNHGVEQLILYDFAGNLISNEQ